MKLFSMPTAMLWLVVTERQSVIVTRYISLDGGIEDPAGVENSGLGDWTGPFRRGPEGDKAKLATVRTVRVRFAYCLCFSPIDGDPHLGEISRIYEGQTHFRVPDARNSSTYLFGDALELRKYASPV
jgi:hypothetical protein